MRILNLHVGMIRTGGAVRDPKISHIHGGSGLDSAMRALLECSSSDALQVQSEGADGRPACWHNARADACREGLRLQHLLSCARVV